MEIKPCPFCGDVNPVLELGWVRCQNLFCITYSTRTYLLKMWNSISFRRGVSEGLWLARLNVDQRNGVSIPKMGSSIYG